MTMNNNTVSREVFESFSGLGLSACGKTSCRLDNFRVLADGSIEKREGVRQIAALPESVRGVCSFPDGKEEVILAVAGKSLFCISADGTCREKSCFNTATGEVGFFVYGGRMYLLDGADLYRYEGNGEIKRVHGYTPLYGKNWDAYAGKSNPIYEPINCLSSHVRIQYRLTSSVDSVCLGLAAKSVTWLKIDGEEMDSSSYYLNGDDTVIHFRQPIYGSFVEVCFLLPESYYQCPELYSCISAAVYEDFENSRLFFYGGTEKEKLFVSGRTTVGSLEEDHALFPDSCGLYFPKDQCFSFGNGQPITAVHRIFDRMMIFFPSSLWVTEIMGDAPDHGVSFTPICGHMGCSAERAVVMTGGSSPISVSRSGIYRWKIDPDLLDECITKSISEELTPFLEEGFFTRAAVCYHRGRGELWFYDAGGKEKRIFLYSLDRQVWYSYSGLSVDRLFSFADGIGFTEGNKVCLFDRERYVDSFADGEREIEAIYESGWLDFGSSDTDKRLESVFLTAASWGGEISVSLEDGKVLAARTLDGVRRDCLGVYECRMPSGRFRMASLRLCVRGRARERIYRAELLAQKGKK